MSWGLETLTFLKCIPSRFSERFQNLYNSVADYGTFLGLSKELIVVIVVVETVHEEVQKIRHNSLGSLCLKQVNQVIVGRWQELYKYLTDYTDPRLLDVKKWESVKVVDDSLDIFLENGIVSGLCQTFQTYLLPFFMKCIC